MAPNISERKRNPFILQKLILRWVIQITLTLVTVIIQQCKDINPLTHSELLAENWLCHPKYLFLNQETYCYHVSYLSVSWSSFRPLKFFSCINLNPHRTNHQHNFCFYFTMVQVSIVFLLMVIGFWCNAWDRKTWYERSNFTPCIRSSYPYYPGSMIMYRNMIKKDLKPLQIVMWTKYSTDDVIELQAKNIFRRKRNLLEIYLTQWLLTIFQLPYSDNCLD